MAAAPLEHADQARLALRTIVTEHGSEMLSRPSVLSNLLADLLPDAPRIARILVAAAQDHIADELREHTSAGMDAATASRLAATMFADATMFPPDACAWVVGEFAVALGLISDNSAPPIRFNPSVTAVMAGDQAKPVAAGPEKSTEPASTKPEPGGPSAGPGGADRGAGEPGGADRGAGEPGGAGRGAAGQGAGGPVAAGRGAKPAAAPGRHRVQGGKAADPKAGDPKAADPKAGTAGRARQHAGGDPHGRIKAPFPAAAGLGPGAGAAGAGAAGAGGVGAVGVEAAEAAEAGGVGAVEVEAAGTWAVEAGAAGAIEGGAAGAIEAGAVGVAADTDRTKAIWTAVVTADRGYFDGVIANGHVDAAAIEFPSDYPERRFELKGSEMRIGRRSVSRKLEPEIDLAGPPTDPGISHLHAVLIAQEDGTWSVLDRGSSNGTLVNGREIESGEPVPLHDGDRVCLGAWTALTFHSNSAT